MATPVSDKVEEAGDSASLEFFARAGLVAYGVVHLLIGWPAAQISWGSGAGDSADTSGAVTTMGYAAVTFDQKDSQGLGRALQEVAAKPFGGFLLTASAVGFVAFGLFSILQSGSRRMAGQ